MACIAKKIGHGEFYIAGTVLLWSSKFFGEGGSSEVVCEACNGPAARLA